MASEIRVDTSKNASGLCTVTYSNTGAIFSGITTGTFSGTTGSFSGDISIADKIVHTGDTDTAIRFPSVNTFSVETANNERLRITSAGRVGINTNNPGSKLTIWADDSDTDTDVFQIRGKTGAFNIRVNDADASNPEWAIRTYSSEPIVFMQGTTERARFDSSGNIGLGTDNPDALLHLQSASSPTIHLEDTTQTTKLKLYAQDSSTVIGNYSNHALQFVSNSISRIQLTNDGKVQIGLPGGSNSLPGAVDSVSIRARDEGNLHIRDIGNLVSPPGGSGVGIDVLNNASNTVKDLCVRGATVMLRNASGETVRIDSSGRLGIGDNSPTVAVSIKNTAPKIKFIDSDATGTPETLVDGSGGDLILDVDKDNEKGSTLFAVKIDGSEKLRIDSNGVLTTKQSNTNTSSSSWNGAIFSIQNTHDTDNNSSVLYFMNAGTGVDCAIQGIHQDAAGTGSARRGHLQFGTSGANSSGSCVERLRITSEGQMGLGMTPGRMFEVKDSTNANRIMNIRGTGTSGAFLAFLDANTTDDSYVRVGSKGGNALSLRGNEHHFERGHDGLSRMIINSGGQVLVGTATAPAFTNRRFTVYDSTNSGTCALEIRGSSSGTSRLYFTSSTNSGQTGSYAGKVLYDHADNFMAFYTNGSNERFRIDSSGNVTTCANTSFNRSTAGHTMRAGDAFNATRAGGTPLEVNRETNDGALVNWFQANSHEGSVTVSGSSVNYGGGVLSRWSQLVGISTNVKADRPTLYQGTVMSNLDEMCEWVGEENMQLNKTQVSTASGDKNVAGVFWAWDDDDDVYTNDFYVAQTGDFIVRVGAATTVTRGDLLESAGDGTAKPQSDDIVRSKTVGKISSGIAYTTYADGSKAYPCVLMAC